MDGNILIPFGRICHRMSAMLKSTESAYGLLWGNGEKMVGRCKPHDLGETWGCRCRMQKKSCRYLLPFERNGNIDNNRRYRFSAMSPNNSNSHQSNLAKDDIADPLYTARCTTVQSAVLGSHVVCLSVRP